MRTIKLYRHGLTMGTVTESNHKRAKRGEVFGWSASASRNNLQFLRSIDESYLDVEGYKAWAVTLTLRDCPQHSDVWKKIRQAFFERLRYNGLLRLHWVTEWQRRGVPHLHIAVWLPEHMTENQIINHWLDLTRTKYRARLSGQYVLPVRDAVGWFKYVAKHTARGASHYQRSPESIPKGWEKTGRVWGKLGDWPIGTHDEMYVCDKAFYSLRRITRAWRIADARSALNNKLDQAIHKQPFLADTDRKKLAKIIAQQEIRRIKQARTMLKNNDKKLSNVRGVSEWVSHKASYKFSQYFTDQGYLYEYV